jgi:hypothetical protein
MMRSRKCGLLILIASAAAGLLSGCATSALWEEGTFANFHEPAALPELRLQYSTRRQDVLVEYLEATEGKSARRVRAFWMYKNLQRVRGGVHPHFESVRPSSDLTPVPIYPHEQDAAATDRSKLYAVQQAGKKEFVLYSGERELGSFELPTYRDPYGRTKQVLLTPFAVAFDVTAFAGVIILMYSPYIIAGLAQSTH